MVKDCHSLCHIKLKQLQPLPLYFCDNWLHELQTNHMRVEQDEAIWAWAKCAFLGKGKEQGCLGAVGSYLKRNPWSNDFPLLLDSSPRPKGQTLCSAGEAVGKVFVSCKWSNRAFSVMRKVCGTLLG